MSDKKPQLWIIAGANGSGKSTLIEKYAKYLPSVEFLNPDNIAKKLEPNTSYHNDAVKLQAGKEIILIQREHLIQKNSFAFETTFSGKHEIDIIKRAKEQNYKINLVYVVLDSPIDNINRVKTRVKKKLK